MKTKYFLPIFLTMFLVPCFTTLAADPIPFIKPRVENGIQYISGGVGKNERDAIQQAFSAENYNLKVVFAIQTGQYLAYIPVTLSDASGNILLQAESNGPWFFAELPAGRYKVTADFSGKRKTSEVSVDGGMRTVRFYWPYD